MSRPLRIEFGGAVYHVTSRGDRCEAIYRDDEDRLAQLEVIAQAMDRPDARVLAYQVWGQGDWPYLWIDATYGGHPGSGLGQV